MARKFLLYLAIALVLLALSSIGGIVLFREQIVKRFIAEASKYLATPVQVRRVDISFWGDFPRLGIVFKDVYIEDSLPEESPLLEAESIAFYIDPIAFIQGRYEVMGLELYDADMNLRINRKGQDNYTIFNTHDTGGEAIAFKLDNIQLAEISFSYQEDRNLHRYLFTSNTMDASIETANDQYDIAAEGQVTIGYLGDSDNPWLRDKTVEVDALLRYVAAKDRLSISPSTISIGNTKFEVRGEYVKERINLSCKGKNTSIQTLLSLMPETLSKRLTQYSSEGDVYFNLLMNGPIGSGKSPALNVQFGLTKTSLFHPDYLSRMSKVTLKGDFSTAALSDLSQANLSLSDVQGELDGQPFEGELSIKNLADPYINARFKGAFAAASLVNFYPVPEIDSLSGNLEIDAFFEGQVGLLKNKENLSEITADGVIELQDVYLGYKRRNVQFSRLNGALRFDNNSLMLDQMRGRINQTDWEMSGLLQNLVPFLVSEGQPLGVRVDVKSPFIDVEELLALAIPPDSSSTQNTNGVQKPFLPPNVEIRLTCDLDALRYDRLSLRNMTGDIVMRRQFVSLNNLAFDGLVGRLTGHGALDTKNPRAIHLIGSVDIKNSNVDSLLYEFQNFGQDFVQDKNLKGKLTALIDFEAILNERLEAFPETVIANIDFSLEEGELNNLEALKAMSKYIPGNKDVSHIVFSELKNTIIIKDKKIIIPPMTVRNNILPFDVGGTHTFDQRIEYRLTIPLTANQKIDSDEAFGAVEKNESGGGLKLFLKVAGTTKKYHISYDREAVRKKFSTQAKEEVAELKEAFRNKGKQQTEDKAIEEESYFDWDAPEGDEASLPKP